MTKQVLSMMLWLGLLTGCATPPAMAPIPSGEPVALVVAMSPQATGEIRIRNTTLGDNTKTGAGSGVLIGAVYGLACGPFAPLCIPITATLGAISGTVAGAAIGATGALSAEKAAQLRDRMGRWRASRDVLGELRTHVTDRARKIWTLDAQATGTVVTVELQDLQFNSTREELAGLVLQVLVSERTSGTTPPPAPRQKLYEYTTPLSPLAVWLDESADFLDSSVHSALQQIATQLVSELAIH